MLKPKPLAKGDKVAAITLSWGGPGTFPHRYEAGKKQVQEAFGVNVVETRHALKPADWIYNKRHIILRRTASISFLDFKSCFIILRSVLSAERRMIFYMNCERHVARRGG